jgi:glyoxylase-like metal-dependent hydrolase (beta-lactamase superfamily II)
MPIGPVRILFGKSPFYPYCNTLWIQDRQTLLVDPACDEQTLRAGAAREQVDFLFNTHYHPDHIRYDTLFPDAEFMAPAGDAPCFRSLDSMAEWVGVKGTRYEKRWKSALTETFGFRERKQVTEVSEGMTLNLGQVTIQFLHLPGHTPGHMGFLIPEYKICFLADMELSAAGPWYPNKRSDIDQTIQSIEKIRKIPANYYIPSHGRVVRREDIDSRLDRYLQNILLREEKIFSALATPRTLDEITSLSLISGFRLLPNLLWYYFEKTMVEKHLARLLSQGRISLEEEKYCQIN